MTTFIADARIARGYAGRPFLHRQVMEMVQADCPGISFANGLDVGCGAGLSAKALRLICRQVTGMDLSEDMVAAARAACTDAACTFVCGSGEAPDFPEKTFDIVSAAGVVDWLDVNRFLSFAGRVLQNGGTLLVYDFWITDRMKDNPAYTGWWHNDYRKRFPKAAAEADALTDAAAVSHGFRPEKQVSFVLEQPFSRAGLADFLMLQSRVNERIRRRGLDAEEVRRQMADSLASVCGEDVLLYFDGYYRRYIYYGDESDTGRGQERADVGGGGGALFSPSAV